MKCLLRVWNCGSARCKNILLWIQVCTGGIPPFYRFIDNPGRKIYHPLKTTSAPGGIYLCRFLKENANLHSSPLFFFLNDQWMDESKQNIITHHDIQGVKWVHKDKTLQCHRNTSDHQTETNELPTSGLWCLLTLKRTFQRPHVVLATTETILEARAHACLLT